MIKTSGMTAAAVLIVAIVGGAAGGAVVMGGSDSPATPPAQVRDVDVVSAETEPSPAPSSPNVEPSAAPVPAATMVPVPAAQDDGDAAPRTETAKEAADRAEGAAKRSESAAERAEKAAQKAEDSVIEAPVADPSPSASPSKVADAGPPPKQPLTTYWGFPCPATGDTMTSEADGPLYCDEKQRWQKGTPPPGLGGPTEAP